MDQKLIWDYYQGLGEEAFQDASPRLRYLVKCARKMMPNKKNCPILNIGVGNGYLEKVALLAGFTPFSLDPSEVAIQKVQQSGGQGKVGYIEAIPYEDEAFDFIFCSEILEHLTIASLKSALSEVKRILKPGGYLIGTVPFNELLKANVVVCPNCNNRFHRWGHEQTFDQTSLERVIQESGFTIVRLETRAFPVFTNKSLVRKFISLGRYVLGRWGFEAALPNLFFVARKMH